MTAIFLSAYGLTLGLIAAIGAQNAHVLRLGLRGEHVLLTVAVSTLGDVVLIGLGVGGIGRLLTAHPDWVGIARYAGAAFLGGYGLRALRSALRGHGGLAPGAGTRLSRRQALLAALGFSLLNPHAYLDTVVLLGSVASRHAEALRPVFAAGAIAASLTWFLALGYGARLLAPLFERPRAWRMLDAAVALMLWGIAASLLLAP